MKDNASLYVKSTKIPASVGYSRPVPDHSCTDAFVAIQIIHCYEYEDQKAIDLLKESGITHELIDLSNCPFTVRLKAKIRRINETPTLIWNDEKIIGPENIQRLLEKIKM